MGRILLCTGKYAKNPYYVESFCANVYCVEELCYLFMSNPFSIDRDIMDKKLAEWLDEECGLSELGHQLLKLLQRGSQPGIFVGMILDYVNYCTPEEKEKIEEVLQNNAGLTDYEKRKKQADFLLKNGRLKLAIEEYDSLIRQLPDTESALSPSLYHNMGTAYAGLFQFEMAAKYFKRAYERSGQSESGISFLMARRLYLSENQYISFIAGHGEYHGLSMEVEKLLERVRGTFETTRENRMLSALEIYKDEGNVASYYDEIDKIISEKKDEYRELVAR